MLITLIASTVSVRTLTKKLMEQTFTECSINFYLVRENPKTPKYILKRRTKWQIDLEMKE